MNKFSLSMLSLLFFLLAGATAGVVAQQQESGPTAFLESDRVIRDWIAVGPLESRSREGSVDPLAQQGGFRHIEPEEGMTHRTQIFPGGEVTWKPLRADEDGHLSFSYEKPDVDRMTGVQSRFMVRAANYAYGELELEADRQAVVVSKDVSRFRINGTVYPGDVYGDGFRVPVSLEKGTNEILLAAGGYPGAEVQFYFASPEGSEPVRPLPGEVTAPDLLRETGRSQIPFGIPVKNLTDSYQRNLDLSLYLPETPRQEEYTRIGQKEGWDLSPLGIRKITVQTDLPALDGEAWADQDTIPFLIEISGDGFSNRWEGSTRIQKRSEPHNITFVSPVDGSTQFFSVYFPSSYNPNREYPLLFSLHGAGVVVNGSNGYSQKDWAFHVFPTNRHRYGFSWHREGRDNMLTTLDLVLDRFPIDRDRVYLAGHSMGGHGAWVNATLSPDRFAAVAPSAGWLSLDFYVDYSIRRDHLFGTPGSRSITYASLQPYRPQSYLENLLHVPAFVLQGGDDESVPPHNARIFTMRLRQLGYEFQYREVPGKGHWWKFEDTDLTDTVDLKEMMAFLRERERVQSPETVRFHTGSLEASSGAYWIEVHRQRNPLRDVRVLAEVRGSDRIDVRVANAGSLSVDLASAPVNGAVDLNVNGSTFQVRAEGDIRFHTRDGFTYQRGKHPALSERLEKRPDRNGPIRQVFRRPFILVYGTSGSRDWENLTYQQARNLAWDWWNRGNGDVRVVPDHAVTPEMVQNYNLVLFGPPAANTFLDDISAELPIRVSGERLMIESGPVERSYDSGAIGTRYIYPNPRNENRFILVTAGNSLRGQELAAAQGLLSSGSGLADFIIAGPEIREVGFGGAYAKGFFDSFWKMDPEFAVFRFPPGTK